MRRTYQFLALILISIQMYFSEVDAGWARIIEDFDAENPQYKRVSRFLTHRINKKRFRNSNKKHGIWLTEKEYHVTQYNATEDPAMGFANFTVPGSYHWVIWDKLIFRSEDKLPYDEEKMIVYPTFNNVVGNVTHVAFMNNGWVCPGVTDARWENCNSHLGEVSDKDESPTGKEWSINSSSLWFIADEGDSEEHNEWRYDPDYMVDF